MLRSHELCILSGVSDVDSSQRYPRDRPCLVGNRNRLVQTAIWRFVSAWSLEDLLLPDPLPGRAVPREGYRSRGLAIDVKHCIISGARPPLHSQLRFARNVSEAHSRPVDPLDRREDWAEPTVVDRYPLGHKAAGAQYSDSSHRRQPGPGSPHVNSEV